MQAATRPPRLAACAARDDWFSDLERRLRETEGRVEVFHFEDLSQNSELCTPLWWLHNRRSGLIRKGKRMLFPMPS